ncbi:MAG: type II toxin-antitoxin system PrlF family antitoxin, partial [Planctomycetaceae bacterium]
MSITSKITSKNQTTIPKAVVQALQIKPSSLLMYEIEPGGRVVLT